jgi:hypothetical protein
LRPIRNKLLACYLVILFLAAHGVQAATYTVKAGGSGSFTTIQACAKAAVAGDTCVVFAGTYNETVSLSTSGAAGAPITFAVNPGDCVTVQGFGLGSVSYVVIGTPGSGMCTTNGLSYSGFEITGGQITWTQIHNVTIQNNYVHNTADVCLAGPGGTSSGASNYIYILNNVITECGGTGDNIAGGMQVEGNHWLIDGNTFSHLEDGIYLYGAYMVVRRNTFGPLSATEYGSQHPDGVESTCEGDFPLQHMLYERNTTINWGGDNAHGLLLRDTHSCGQDENVLRFSQFINVGTYLASNETNSTRELWYNNSSSHDGYALSPMDYSNLTFTQADTGANVINNSFANDWRSGSSDYCIYADATSTSGFVENHNACFLTGWTGSWQAVFGGYQYSSTDIFNKDPLYVDPNADLHISSGSPLIGAGGPLTTAVGSGTSSTSLTVANAGFFSDGYGLTGVQPDWIRIGPSTTVQISSVNYSTNVLTLATSASWSSGDSIYLYKDSTGTIVLNGANPNIGFDQTSGSTSGGSSGGGSQPPLPPTNVQAIAK